MHAFRSSIESREFDRIPNLFAEGAVLNSPIAHRPYQGREVVAKIISAVATASRAFVSKTNWPVGKPEKTPAITR